MEYLNSLRFKFSLSARVLPNAYNRKIWDVQEMNAHNEFLKAENDKYMRYIKYAPHWYDVTYGTNHYGCGSR